MIVNLINQLIAKKTIQFIIIEVSVGLLVFLYINNF